jgi:hypothetical protein
VRKIKYAVEKDKRKMMVDAVREKKNANGGRRVEKYVINTGLPPGESFTFIVHEHDFAHDPS